VQYGVTPVPTTAARRGPEPRDTWQYRSPPMLGGGVRSRRTRGLGLWGTWQRVDVCPAPCLYLKLIRKWMETSISFNATDCPKSMAGAGKLPLLVSPAIANIKLYHILIALHSTSSASQLLRSYKF
jgi:hypothetical protein